jgi:hypothetical protein
LNIKARKVVFNDANTSQEFLAISHFFSSLEDTISENPVRFIDALRTLSYNL